MEAAARNQGIYVTILDSTHVWYLAAPKVRPSSLLDTAFPLTNISSTACSELPQAGLSALTHRLEVFIYSITQRGASEYLTLSDKAYSK